MYIFADSEVPVMSLRNSISFLHHYKLPLSQILTLSVL